MPAFPSHFLLIWSKYEYFQFLKFIALYNEAVNSGQMNNMRISYSLILSSITLSQTLTPPNFLDMIITIGTPHCNSHDVIFYNIN